MFQPTKVRLTVNAQKDVTFVSRSQAHVLIVYAGRRVVCDVGSRPTGTITVDCDFLRYSPGRTGFVQRTDIGNKKQHLGVGTALSCYSRVKKYCTHPKVLYVVANVCHNKASYFLLLGQ